MKKNWTITPDSFNKLLLWLDADSDQAASKYQLIQAKLIKIFISRGFSNAEDLADEVLNRVSSKIDEIAPKYQGNKSAYFVAVASKIIFETNRNNKEISLNEAITKAEMVSEPDLKFNCLDECLKKLPPDQHQLILSYYEVDKSDKASKRLELSNVFHLNISTLRVQISRIRLTLKHCIEDCVKKS